MDFSLVLSTLTLHLKAISTRGGKLGGLLTEEVNVILKLIFSLKKRPVPVNYTRNKFFSLKHSSVWFMVMLNKLCLAKYAQQNKVKNRSYERFNTGNKIIYIPIHIKGFIFARLFDFLPCSNSSSLIWSKIWSDANFCSQSF